MPSDFSFPCCAGDVIHRRCGSEGLGPVQYSWRVRLAELYVHCRYSVMQRCWGTCGSRPTFADLVTDYSSQLQGLAGYLDLLTAPSNQQLQQTDYYVASAW